MREGRELTSSSSHPVNRSSTEVRLLARVGGSQRCDGVDEMKLVVGLAMA